MPRHSGKHWSMDGFRVLAAIYFNSNFSIGDDARSGCHLMADRFERDPASIGKLHRRCRSLASAMLAYPQTVFCTLQ